ncbi:hypothetical protein ACWEP4_38315 [Streptomyces sp. NPDC004227]
MGALAEADVELAERAADEVHVRLVQQRCLLRAEPSVIQRPEHRIVPGGGSVLPRRGDPLLHEVEELRHSLRCGWWHQGRGVVADMSGGVELVDRADQADAERRLDLGSLAGLQKPVEPLEDLDVLTTRRGLAALHGEVTDHAVDVLRGHLPRWPAQRGQRPLQQTDVVVDGHRAEPAGPPRGDERVDACGLELPRIRDLWLLRNGPARDDLESRLGHRHTFLAPERSRQHPENLGATARTNEDRRKGIRSCASLIGSMHGTTRRHLKRFSDPGGFTRPSKAPALSTAAAKYLASF